MVTGRRRFPLPLPELPTARGNGNWEVQLASPSIAVLAGPSNSVIGLINQLGYLETFVRPRKPDVIVLVFVSNDFANNSPLLEAIRVGWHPAHAPRMRNTTKPDTEYERSRTAVRRSRTAPPIDGFTDS